jgi:uncharacterized OB-fold protein
MSAKSITPDFAALDVPMDVYSAPFWQGAAEHRLTFPSCTACGTFRWPAGPFCPKCHTQPVEWKPAGAASVYSFTVLPVRDTGEQRIPVLAVFAGAPGVRLVTVLVDAEPQQVAIGAPLVADWLPAANATIPVFRLEPLE